MDLQKVLERKSIDELIRMLESAKAIASREQSEFAEQAQVWYANERAAIINAIRVVSKRSTLRKTRTGLHITGGITLGQWLVIADKNEETDPGILYVEELFGRMVITMNQNEQEHVKRYLRGYITESELVKKVG